MRRAKIMIMGYLALLSAPSGAGARVDEPPPGADLISSIGLARLADEAGDAQLARWLSEPAHRDRALAAVRASPFAYAPERLVPGLSAILCGRDPVLAPESASALLELAERLRPSELAARECLLSDLRSARKALACVGEQPAEVRADLALAAMVVDAALAQLAP